ncbi:MAG: SpoIID/LytB domain-containing protein [Spirochaetes bacterium]|nr:SpoIID/LytB domain-containing protein [Spirochaetota bacterium]
MPGGIHTRSNLFAAACAGLSLLIGSCVPFMNRKYYPGNFDTTTVRILISRTRSTVTITSRSAYRMSGNMAGHQLPESPSTKLVLHPEKAAGTIVLDPGVYPLLLNGAPYRGGFIITAIKGELFVVNKLKIDEYLMSVVPGEIPADWNEEALKAQAIAARTYAYYHLLKAGKVESLYDLDATTSFQVYRGMSEEKQRTSEAVAATAGEIIVYENKPILSFFHSTCGGKTADDKYVWKGNNLPYLKGVSCGFCSDSTKYSWETRLSLAEIRKGLQHKYPGIGAIRSINFKKRQGRVTLVSIRHSKGRIAVPGNTFRLFFPDDKIRSLYFSSKKIRNGIVLSGHGWGHGVGMCQWGARGMAKEGYGYKKILLHYYTNVNISSIRNSNVASAIKESYDRQ